MKNGAPIKAVSTPRGISTSVNYWDFIAAKEKWLPRSWQPPTGINIFQRFAINGDDQANPPNHAVTETWPQ
jgi:hypothetical protein